VSWRDRSPPGDELPAGFFVRDTGAVARDLLGKRLRSTVEGRRTEGMIVEVEAYLGPEDPASHAAERIGRTARNEAMFGPGGTAYVYLIYGMHRCMNVVTGREGDPTAILIRALEPLDGLETMRERRGGRPELTPGPGRLGQALAIDRSLSGHDLTREPLRLLPGWDVPEPMIEVGPRIGVTRAVDRPLRFWIAGNRWVSRTGG